MKRRILALAASAMAAAAVFCFLLWPARATHYVQRGDKLVGADFRGTSEQGVHVALSSDGMTALVGGWRDDGGAGAAWIYSRARDAWLQMGPKLTGAAAAGAAQFGFAVALSGDGTTAIIGGISDDQSSGAAWVFTRRGGSWTQQGDKLVGSHLAGAANFGFSVDLSDDGNTAIVGGFYDSAGVGAAWVFTRAGDSWTQQGEKLVRGGIGGFGAYFGTAVALSADGSIALIGGNVENEGVGAAWVFTRSESVWSPEGGKLVGAGAVGDSHQGNSVALSSDGNTAMLGGHFDDSHRGAAWIFRRTAGVWEQQGEKLVGADAASMANQGISVCLSGDGATAAVGGNVDDVGVGAAWVFTRAGDRWTQLGSKIVATRSAGAHQGSGVCLSEDGGTLLVGGQGDHEKIGAAWVYTRSRIPFFSSR